MQTMLSPKDFAEICQEAHRIREYSWLPNRGRYDKDWNEATQEACTSLGYNPQWARIIAILIFPGYSDVWDWCEEVSKA